jgi:hypothetical protein
MAKQENFKILGQASPNATTAITLYTVPASTQSVVSTINICNTTASTATCRIAAIPSGESLSLKHYIAYDAIVTAKDSVSLTIGVTLATGDILSVYASSASVSFNAFGSEVS